MLYVHDLVGRIHLFFILYPTAFLPLPSLFHTPSPELVWKVARYTSAAPLYFSEMDHYVDGGVLANNPCEYALTAINNFYRLLNTFWCRNFINLLRSMPGFFTTLDQTILYGSEPVLFKQLLINTTFPMQCHCIYSYL